MPSINIRMKRVCAGGSHAQLNIGGDVSLPNVPMVIPDCLSPLTEEESEKLVHYLLRLPYNRWTLKELRNALNAGININIEYRKRR